MPFFTNRGIVPLPTGLTPGAEATAFLARANASTALDAPHSNAYIDLINGLVADGVWAQLDVLHIYATDTAAHALLNLISSTYAATTNGSPTFTADRGYTGAGAGTSLDPHFVPATAIGVPTHYQQNAACIGAWCVTTSVSESVIETDANTLNIYPNYTSTTAYARVNDATASTGFATSDAGIGFFLGVRTGSGASTPDRTFYRNGVSVGTYVGAIPSGMTAGGTGVAIIDTYNAQVAAFVLGGNVDSVQLQLYNRLRTYMTAVGVP